MNEVDQRIKALRKKLKKTQKEFGSSLGFHPSYIGKLEAGKTHYTEHLLKLVEQIYHVNPEWLRKGKGPMFLEHEEDLPADIALSYRGSLKETFSEFKGFWYPGEDLSHLEKRNVIMFPIYKQEDLAEVERDRTSVNPIDFIPVRVGWINKHTVCIKISDNSMEPTFRGGTNLLIDLNQKSIIDGRIYALEIPTIGVAIKRVFIHDLEG